MKMKKMVSFLLACATVFCVTGCGAQAAAKENDGAASAENVRKMTETVQEIPYFGNFKKSKLTGAQARAYAAAIENGIQKGWDTKQTLEGYEGEYSADRGYACLCDFAGDGSPYLLTFDGSHLLNTFTLYGYVNGKAKQLLDCDSLACRETFKLYVKNGKTFLEDRQSMGWASGEQIVYSFSKGGVKQYYKSEWDGDDSGIRITVINQNGKKSSKYYSAAKAKNVPFCMSLTEKSKIYQSISPSCALADMAESLKQFAGLTAAGVKLASLPDAAFIKKAPADQAKKTAMLKEINQTSNAFYAALADFDGDKETELLLCSVDDSQLDDDGTFYNFTDANYMIYDWKDGKLTGRNVGPWSGASDRGYMADDGVLCRDANGVSYVRYYEATDSENYRYVNLNTRLDFIRNLDTFKDSDGEYDDLSNVIEFYNTNGVEKDLTEAQRNEMMKKYPVVDTIFGERADENLIRTHKTVDQVKTALLH